MHGATADGGAPSQGAEAKGGGACLVEGDELILAGEGVAADDFEVLPAVGFAEQELEIREVVEHVVLGLALLVMPPGGIGCQEGDRGKTKVGAADHGDSLRVGPFVKVVSVRGCSPTGDAACRSLCSVARVNRDSILWRDVGMHKLEAIELRGGLEGCMAELFIGVKHRHIAIDEVQREG